MNKSSVKKKRPAKASRSSAVRKSPNRTTAARKIASKAAPSKTASRPQARKSEPVARAVKSNGIRAVKSVAAPKSIPESAPITVPMGTVTVAQVTALSPPLRTHRFRVGQTVFYTSSPISRPGATGTYEVVRLLPSDGDDYQYRIKNPGEAFERVAKESQLELELEH
jgi:hypothetical protein